MQLNWLALLSASIIPLIVGFIWYHPKVFGNAWMRAAGLTDEDMKKFNMPVVFGSTLVLGFFFAVSLNFVVIHQWHFFSLLADDPGINDPNSETGRTLTAFIGQYGDRFRTFKHGAFHGILNGITFALPIIAVTALYERKSWKYILLNAGFWMTCMALMGGVICGWR